MKILFISTTFPDAASPTRGTYNAALCRALAEGHSLHVISPRNFPEAFRTWRRGTRCRRPDDLASRGITADYPVYWYTPRLLQHRYGEQMWWSVRSDVERALRRFRPDAVLSYWAHPDGEAGVRAAQLAGIPSAVIVGGTDVLILPQIPRRGERVRDVLLQSDAVITVSDGLKAAVVRLGSSPERVHTIYQGVDPQLFHTRISRSGSRRQLRLTDDTYHLLWVGRMVPVKALENLLGAVGLLHAQGERIRLHLVGDGPQRASLQREASRRNLNDVVHFAGPVAHEQLADWYRAADLTVLSSDSEGLPNVLRESLACGTPFVSTDVGSVRELADERFSALVPKRDPGALAATIRTLLAPGFRERAAQCQARTWPESAAETASLLQRLCDRKRGCREPGGKSIRIDLPPLRGIAEQPGVRPSL